MSETLDNYISTIQTAVKGESVRSAICNALEYMDEHGSNSVEKWGGHLPEEYITKAEVNRLFCGETVSLNGVDFKAFLDTPESGSTQALTSSAVYSVLNALAAMLDTINGESI